MIQVLLILFCTIITNIDMRKLTTKFFLDLVYDNYIVQQVFCDILGIVPWDGKVNKLPFFTFSKVILDLLK